MSFTVLAFIFQFKFNSSICFPICNCHFNRPTVTSKYPAACEWRYFVAVKISESIGQGFLLRMISVSIFYSCDFDWSPDDVRRGHHFFVLHSIFAYLRYVHTEIVSPARSTCAFLSVCFIILSRHSRFSFVSYCIRGCDRSSLFASNQLVSLMKDSQS